MDDIRKDALTAADKFEIRCNAARVNKAALAAVAAHEKTSMLLTTTGDPDEDKILQALRQRPMTTGEIEKTLFAGAKYSTNSWAAVTRLKEKGFIKQKQMRWYLTPSAAGGREASSKIAAKVHKYLVVAPDVPEGHEFWSKVPDLENKPELWEEACPFEDAVRVENLGVDGMDMQQAFEPGNRRRIDGAPKENLGLSRYRRKTDPLMASEGEEMEKLYLDQMAASAHTAAHGFNPEMLWRYGGWLQPNSNATPEIADTETAFQQGAIYFDPDGAGSIDIKYRSNRHTDERLKQFIEKFPPPEGLKLVIKGGGGVNTINDLLGAPPVTASKTAAPGDPPDPNLERTHPATDPVPENKAPEPEPEPSENEELGVRTEVEAAIDDPETVTAVMEFLKKEDYLGAHGLEVAPGMWNWKEASNFATVSFGDKEYVVAPSYDSAEQLAIVMVEQQLQSEPEMFTQSMLESYIDKERLRDALRPDVEEMVRESPDSYGEWTPEGIREEEEGDAQMSLTEQDGPPSDQWVEEMVDKLLKDPIEYLEGIYGDETLKRAIDIAGIDETEAATDFVAADGMGHFLSSYDGNYNELPSGGVYWRLN
jgi:hypothetical protein